MLKFSDLAADAAWLESEWGIIVPGGAGYIEPHFRKNFDFAMDAQPTLITNVNAGIPSWMTQFVSPEVIEVLQAPNKAAEIYDEVKQGDWTDDTAWYPMSENVGEVSTYGDQSANGKSDVNMQWESRQSYLFQTFIEYGDREVARAARAKLNLVSLKQGAAAKTLNKFADYCYHFGVNGLANYGVLNDPSLSAAVTPTTKAYGGVKWVNNGQIVAAASEVYADFQVLYAQATSNTFGGIDMNTKFKLISPNTVNAALTATNSFGITVRKFIQESFPNVEYISDPRYATPAGNVVQLVAEEFDGAKTSILSFNEKMRQHRLVPSDSSFRQKTTSGVFGAIITRPLGVNQMIGV